MAERILLVNPLKPPSKRRKKAPKKAKPKATRRKSTMAKRRTAAQKRATARLVAFNKRKSRKSPARKRKPASSRAVAKRRVRRAPARRSNPIRRRRRAASPVASRRRRRNPISRKMGVKGIVDNLMIPAATAAGGALALDALWAYLPIPANVKQGAWKHVAKGAGAIALNYVASMVVSKKVADELAFGALTVVMHQAARDFAARSIPALRLDGMGYMSPALPAGVDDGMGFYPAQGMGYYPPTPVAPDMAPVESETNHNYS